MTYFLLFSILASSLIISVLLYFIHISVKNISDSFDVLLNVYQYGESRVDEQLTSYEVEMYKQHQAFDERIEKLKQEVQEGVQNVKNVGTTAEELHPLVHNLPHDSVKTKYDISTYEEVAD